MEAKYIIFLLVVVFGIPIGVLICKTWQSMMHVVAVVLVWATCEPDLVGINFVSREFYRANTRGFEISLVDICVWILMITMLLKRKEVPFRWFPPLTIPTLIYLAVGIVSWLLAGSLITVPEEAKLIPYEQFEVGLYPLFELSKIFRGFLLYLVIVNYVRDEKTAQTILFGIGLTALYMTWLAVSSRYLYGINRVRATLGHPNSLATYMAMLGTFVFAFALQRRQWLGSLVFGFLTLCAAISVILTISRGGLAGLVLGIWLNAMVLLPRHFNVKNIVLLFIGLVVAVVVLAMALNTLMNRFGGEQDASADLAYRGLYNQEGRLMAKDHAWGVGLGNFSAWSWLKYAGDVDPDLPPGTPAHNNWYLTLGELGIPGVIALAFFWLRFAGLALPFYVRKGKSLFHALAVASTTALLVDHLQSCLQLGYRQTPMYFMMMIFVGMVVAVWYAGHEAENVPSITSIPIASSTPVDYTQPP
ncbi:MAG: O-antigen ligase family protein [bacterium]